MKDVSIRTFEVAVVVTGLVLLRAVAMPDLCSSLRITHWQRQTTHVTTCNSTVQIEIDVSPDLGAH